MKWNEECLLKSGKLGVNRARADKKKGDTHNEMITYRPGAFGLSTEPEIDFDGSKKHNGNKSSKQSGNSSSIVRNTKEFPLTFVDEQDNIMKV